MYIQSPSWTWMRMQNPSGRHRCNAWSSSALTCELGRRTAEDMHFRTCVQHQAAGPGATWCCIKCFTACHSLAAVGQASYLHFCPSILSACMLLCVAHACPRMLLAHMLTSAAGCRASSCGPWTGSTSPGRPCSSPSADPLAAWSQPLEGRQRTAAAPLALARPRAMIRSTVTAHQASGGPRGNAQCKAAAL